MTKRIFATLTVAIVALALPVLMGTNSCAPSDLRPIIFVHGASGSGAQFESQALRFTSNLYPQRYLTVVEYDSGNLVFPEDLEVVHAEIDARIAQLQAELGVEQVDLIGHSRGTTVGQDYLSSPDRAANVAHYVNIDGQPAAAPPGGVPTLALWAGAARPVQPEITGATNVTVPDQEHIEVAVSEESFVEMYRFFRGHKPFTAKVIPEVRPKVSGRATFFPANAGLDGATLDIWLLDRDTGERIGPHPKATFEIGPDGDWGPFRAFFGLYYEFELSREGETSLHYFFEPFLRSDHLVRLNVAVGLAPFIDSSPNHTALTITRNKEFRGDRSVAENDVLAIDGTNVMNPVVGASGAVGVASSAYFGFDDGSDMMSNLMAIPFPFALVPFLTGSDLYIPASPPATVTIDTVPRGQVDEARTIRVRNIPSSEGRVVVTLYDFEP